MPRSASVSVRLAASRRYSSLHIRQLAPSSSTTTAIAESGFGGRGHIGEVLDGPGQFIGKINAHNASHLAAIDRDQNERFLGHEAEDGGQGGDQDAGPVQTEVG